MLFTVILVLLALRSDALPFLRPGEEPSRIHAVLMAGVPGGIHDAMNNAMNVNVARMYHQLLDRGVPAANIIVFLNDDITNNPELNPFPGHLYTGPERKKDWREGVLVDYTSFDINVENYIAVLTSNAENLNLTKGGSGRVLKSGPHDRVFILHSSHGADGLICVNLHGMTKKQLHDTFDQMISKKLFSELTFYLSACQSGSMFADDMERFPTIYGLTGALPNQFEIMFGYTAQVDGRNITTGKYGEFFNALYNELLNSAATELLSEQFEEVRSKVKASTVTQYGNLSITKTTNWRFRRTTTTAFNFRTNCV
ncbi:hypothetical protein M3Y94_00043700 [Aphelenchoides besseyi]|nr:hypothetical protein M3Y94_00043700 [Aphelenchoides besseyi]